MARKDIVYRNLVKTKDRVDSEQVNMLRSANDIAFKKVKGEQNSLEAISYFAGLGSFEQVIKCSTEEP